MTTSFYHLDDSPTRDSLTDPSRGSAGEMGCKGRTVDG